MLHAARCRDQSLVVAGRCEFTRGVARAALHSLGDGDQSGGSARRVSSSSVPCAAFYEAPRESPDYTAPTLVAKMKSAYAICALLSVTIGTLALADDGAALQIKPAPESPVSPSRAVESSKNVIHHDDPPTSNTNISTSTTETTISTTNATGPNTTDTTTATPDPKTTISTTTTSTSSKPPTTTPNTTTSIPTTTPTPSTSSTVKPTTAPTPPSTTTHAPTSTLTPTSTAAAKTTPVPEPSPSKDRHFDGLSFFGGIILTTCLMAIAAFSWKFYRQCKEGNYRTL